MMIFRSRAASALAAAAALSLTATPAMARGWHRHHRDGIDAGDVLAGVLILGGIAAIASAASKSSRERQARADDRYRDSRDYRDDNARYVPPVDDRSQDYSDRPGSNWRSGLSVDGAVDACVGEVEQGDRSIDSVETVNREGDGWRVSGRMRGGRDFACSIDGQGRVRSVTGL